MYSFKFQQNKESIAINIAPKDGDYVVQVTLAGKPYSRVLLHNVSEAHYVKDGDLTFMLSANTLVLIWSVVGKNIYDNRRITVDLDTGKLTYEIWTSVPAPMWHVYIELFEHDLTADPSPSYKIYKHKDQLKAKPL